MYYLVGIHMSVVEGIGASASASIAVAVAVATAGQQLQASPLDARVREGWYLVGGRLRCSCAVTSQLPALVTTEAAEGGAAHCPAYRLTSSLACLPTDCLSPTYLLLVTTITASPPHHHRYFCPLHHRCLVRSGKTILGHPQSTCRRPM